MTSNWKARLLHAAWIGSFIVLCGTMSQPVGGQSPLSTDGEDTRERIAILRSGKTLSGKILSSAGGYVVEQPDRRVWYPRTEILYIVNDLHEAYNKLRNSITTPTAAIHFTLAEWCLSNRMYEEASEELKNCLKLDPEHKKANSLSQQLADVMRVNLPAPAARPTRQMTADGFLQPEVESLGGLSRETATQFTSKIQPLLMNKCGNAACHGTTSSQEFRLTGSRGGSVSRHNTERNLAAVMKYIDLHGVSQSPLLSASKSGHGGKGAVFGDSGGTEQQKLLKTWTQNAAEEMKASETQMAQRPTIKNQSRARKSVRPSSANEIIPAAYTSDDSDGQVSSKNQEISPPRELPVEDDEAMPAALKSLSRPHRRADSPSPQNEKSKTDPKTLDAFDPENFNRRFK